MKRLSNAVFVFACMLAAPAIAQSQQVGVPILKAPYHLPVFTNEYVTVLKIFIPPARNTGYHTHTEDSVSVNIVPAATLWHARSRGLYARVSELNPSLFLTSRIRDEIVTPNK
jgi:hypothetical protein